MGVDLLIEAVSGATVTLLNDRIATITPASPATVRVMTTGVPPAQLGFKSVDDSTNSVGVQYFITRHGYLISGALDSLPTPPKGCGIMIELQGHGGVEILAAGW